MHLTIFLLHKDWDDFYPLSINPEIIKKYSKKSEYDKSGNLNIYFVDSIVQGLTNRVIFIANYNLRLLIESCKFDDISTSNNQGGMIYYQTSGEVVHNKICANQCRQNGQFGGVYSYHNVKNDDKSKNYIIESSIIRSFSENGGRIFLHYRGDMKLSKNNLTDSVTSYNPCIYMIVPSKDVEISQMIFSNNKGRHSDACSYHSGDYKYIYSYCDILDNQCPQQGVLWFNTNCAFSSCNILYNVALTNNLFYMESGSMTTTSCFIINPRANSNYNANPVSDVRNSIDQPIIKIGCQYLNFFKDNHLTCNKCVYSDKSIYKLVVLCLFVQ